MGFLKTWGAGECDRFPENPKPSNKGQGRTVPHVMAAAATSQCLKSRIAADMGRDFNRVSQ